jgi:hypothetical protein
MNVKLAGNPIDVWLPDPVTLIFGQVGVNAKAPHPNAARLAANFMLSQECQEFLARFDAFPPARSDRESARDHRELTQKKVITVRWGDEERRWQRRLTSCSRSAAPCPDAARASAYTRFPPISGRGCAKGCAADPGRHKLQVGTRRCVVRSRSSALSSATRCGGRNRT